MEGICQGAPDTSLPILPADRELARLARALAHPARGEPPPILEAGAAIGHTVRQWGHVQIFSPWRYNIDQAARRLLWAMRREHLATVFGGGPGRG